MATNINFLKAEPTSITTGRLTDFNSTGQGLFNYGVYTKGTKNDYESNESEIILTSTNPSTLNSRITESILSVDNVWTFPLELDGWYRFLYIAAPFWSSTISYVVNDIVYDEVTDLIYQVNTDVLGGSTASTNTNFTLVSDPSSLITSIGSVTEPTNMIYQDYNVILHPNLNKKFGDVASKAALESCGDCKRASDTLTYELLKVMVDGLAISNSRGEYIKGEKIAVRSNFIQV